MKMFQLKHHPCHLLQQALKMIFLQNFKEKQPKSWNGSGFTAPATVK